MDGQRLKDVEKFYGCLHALAHACGGSRLLSECTGRQNWPRRGVYFFMEPGEERTHSGIGPRIVRIGTHALTAGSASTLWGRLSQHRGRTQGGGGNHRGSIFRLIVGTALIARDRHACPTWDDRKSVASATVRAGELALEQVVSRTVGAMRFLWLAIDDEPSHESARGYIERNSIALLSNYRNGPIDPPSPSWLGHHCSRERIRASGLWNANHVDEPYDGNFIDRMQAFVGATVTR